ncbi:mucin-1-like [Panicum virgatum]|uniref:mucin-1-like n=1 Tax=Panicum virgatum TaxID=38727 RepID=UPI0019D5F9C3|nr:mucin-1-like [Panicum virgatum]
MLARPTPLARKPAAAHPHAAATARPPARYPDADAARPRAARRRSPARRRRTPACSPTPRRSATRHRRHPYLHTGPATPAPAGHRSHAAEPRRPRACHPGAGTRPANGLDGAREPTSTPSPSRERVAGRRGCYATSLTGARARPATLAPGLSLAGAHHPDADALAAGCWSPRPGWLRPGSALAAVTLAAATHVAPLVAARRGHNRCSLRQRSLLAAATLAAPTFAAPTLPAPRAHA